MTIPKYIEWLYANPKYSGLRQFEWKVVHHFLLDSAVVSFFECKQVLEQKIKQQPPKVNLEQYLGLLIQSFQKLHQEVTIPAAGDPDLEPYVWTVNQRFKQLLAYLNQALNELEGKEKQTSTTDPKFTISRQVLAIHYLLKYCKAPPC